MKIMKEQYFNILKIEFGMVVSKIFHTVSHMYHTISVFSLSSHMMEAYL
jgi:hypothetical protein